MSSQPLPRASPSRLKTTAKTAPCPTQIPLPPSPPASGGNLIGDPYASRPSSSPQRPRRNCSRAKPPSVAKNTRSNRRVVESVDAPQLFPNPTSVRTRSKRSRVVAEQFDCSSPPTSPTNRKSTRSSKRLKLSSPSPSRRSLRIPARSEHRDTPNNPFLAKPGEKPRRADSRRDGGHRQLIYVFRGKRIPYDTAEDLDHTGESPFNLTGPKLLFPSPPSPAPVPKITLQAEQTDDTGLLTSPQRRSQVQIHPAFQTPKRDKSKSTLAPPAMLPTPQSRPRRSQRAQPNLSDQALTSVVKSSRTMAKAMR